MPACSYTSRQDGLRSLILFLSTDALPCGVASGGNPLSDTFMGNNRKQEQPGDLEAMITCRNF